MHDVVFVNNVHTYYIHVANFTYTYLLCILTNALQTKCRYIYIYTYIIIQISIYIIHMMPYMHIIYLHTTYMKYMKYM